ncbi:MAG: hypothetical protein JXQ73_11420 [Phycisphaerae bacterium]|nr:hypothetical protein [Phycisphaerae bacterium]
MGSRKRRRDEDSSNNSQRREKEHTEAETPAPESKAEPRSSLVDLLVALWEGKSVSVIEWFRKRRSVTAIALGALLVSSGFLFAYRSHPKIRKLHQLIAPSIQAYPVAGNAPPLDSYLVHIENLPQGVSADWFRVELDNAKLDSSRAEFQIRLRGDGTGDLEIPVSQFAWADKSGRIARLVIYCRGVAIHTESIAIARRPWLEIQESPSVRLLSSPTAPLTEQTVAAIHELLNERQKDDFRVYLVGPARLRWRLPAIVAANPQGIEICFDGRTLGLPDDPCAPMGLDEISTPEFDRIGSHWLVLKRFGRVLSRALLIRYLEPLREPKHGTAWKLPSALAPYWRFSPRQCPGTINARKMPTRRNRHCPGHCRLHFPHLLVPIEPGLYATEVVFENAQGGSISLPFTPSIEALVPRAIGVCQPSFKLAREWSWHRSGRATVCESLRREGIELVFNPCAQDDTWDAELKFPSWPKTITIEDGYPHSAALIVRIRRLTSGRFGVELRLYLDSTRVASFSLSVDSVHVTLYPELRRRGGDALTISAFRVLRVREGSELVSADPYQNTQPVLALGHPRPTTTDKVTAMDVYGGQ